MRDEDGSAVSAPCGFSKECVARVTRSSFERDLLLLPERADVCRTQFKSKATDHCRATASVAGSRAWQAERLPCNVLVVAVDQSLNKPRVSITRVGTQSMIQVANDQSVVTEAD